MNRSDFEKLSLEHLDAMYRFALQLTRRPDEAADLVQDAYVKALRASDRFEQSGGGIRPWLLKILHNTFYTRLHQGRRKPAGMPDGQEAVSRESLPDEGEPAWDLASLDWEQVDDRLKAAIEQLRPEYRTVLLLWGVEGLKYREIAEIEQVPIGTVMSRLHRARLLLGRRLVELAEENRIRGG